MAFNGKLAFFPDFQYCLPSFAKASEAPACSGAGVERALTQSLGRSPQCMQGTGGTPGTPGTADQQVTEEPGLAKAHLQGCGNMIFFNFK